MKAQNQMMSHLNRQSINKPQLLFLLFAALAFTLTAFTRPVVYSSTCHFNTDFETINDDSTAEASCFGDAIDTLLKIQCG